MLQLVTDDGRRSTTTNLDDATSEAIVEVLSLPFRHVTIELTGEVLEARVTKKGGLVSSRTPIPQRPVVLTHDRPKRHPISEDAPFLETLRLASGGHVKPSRQAKFRQINEFIRILEGAAAWTRLRERERVQVVDLGCGNGYLTFAVHHYLSAAGRTCDVIGVDRDAGLIERNRQRAVDGLRFEVGDISSFIPDDGPDIVMALHACDTATDDALAAAVRWKSDLALVAPCCHHHVQAQADRSVLEPAEGLMLRHRILKERTGDVVTDTARATLMRLAGYDVDVVEFVAPEDTPKNLLIRASRESLPVPQHLVVAYDAFTTRWAVRPYLEDLLRSEHVFGTVERG